MSESVSEQQTLNQIIKECCNGCACTGTEQEQLDCFKLVFRRFLQQKREPKFLGTFLVNRKAIEFIDECLEELK